MQFGTSFEPIGTVVMKNPGSSTFKDGECHNITDERLLNKLSRYNDSGISEIDNAPWFEFSADATMNCVKSMFKEYYHVDFDNIQSSVDNFSENFIKEHYINYEEDLFSMMFRSENELCDYRFGKDLVRRLSNIFRLCLNQTTFELIPHIIDIIGIFPDIKNNINMVEEFMESNSYFPVNYEYVNGPKDTYWKVVKFTTTQKTEYVNVYKGDFVYYIAPQINREFIGKYGIRREMIDNTYDSPHRIYAFTKDIPFEDVYEKYVRMAEYLCKKIYSRHIQD